MSIPEQSHQWMRNLFALELICERCGFHIAVAPLARMGWDTSNEEAMYWALCGNDLFSNGCCPRRVN